MAAESAVRGWLELMPWKVFAIRYATSGGRRLIDRFIDNTGGARHAAVMDLYCFVILGPRVILVDTGAGRREVEARGHRFLGCPVSALADLGVSAADVSDIIVTHMHWDHIGNIAKYPDARLHVQAAELGFATGIMMGERVMQRPYSAATVAEMVTRLHAGQVSVYQGDAELEPGIEMIEVGGHSAGLQVVSVETEGGKVVLAGDASHFEANRTTRNPFPVVVDVAAAIRAFHRMERMGARPDLIVPGHDPVIAERFPLVGETTGASVFAIR